MTFSVNSGLPNKPVYQAPKKANESSEVKTKEASHDDVSDKLELQFIGLVSPVPSDGPDLSEAEAKNLSYLVGVKLEENQVALTNEPPYSETEAIELSLRLGQSVEATGFLTDPARQALSVAL